MDFLIVGGGKPLKVNYNIFNENDVKYIESLSQRFYREFNYAFLSKSLMSKKEIDKYKVSIVKRTNAFNIFFSVPKETYRTLFLLKTYFIPFINRKKFYKELLDLNGYK